MDIVIELKTKLLEALKKMGVNLTVDDIVIENSKDSSHGDYATNVAMKYCKEFQKPPREVANLILSNLDMSGIDKVEIAGPGFINLFLKKDSLQSIVKTVIELDNNYGALPKNGKKINVEFVSANPTGDLHVGHARGAAIGDSLCRILSFAGYEVTREYYINDAGSQIKHLGESVYARYRELFGLDFNLPEDGYHGQDIIDIAKIIKDEIGDEALKMEDPVSYFMRRGQDLELEKINRDLQVFRVKFDIFSSELKIRSNKAVEKELEYLSNHLYREEGALVLKTTDFLDDKDRVVVKSNGEYTYFLPDIVYHCNKLSRGFDQLIDVLGADHHGYINRMKSALMMHGYDKDVLDVSLIQMVRIMKDGEEMKASKRTGNAYTLRELCEDVGVDAARYFFAMRASTSHLDFDMNLAVEQSSTNPVYYAQYAHARLCSVLDNSSDIEIDISAKNLKEKSEINLLKFIQNWPNVVKEASDEKAPYKITNYIHSLAELVHVFYTECRVIDRDNLSVTSSRLALCKASKIVLENALNLVGVSAPSHM
ncbi:MAG: arginine--tRNA ligase [Bacilli bacterium]|nr:arginine--tRNA ligase [Bacilli bacterium]